jgi:hypothetical protein
MPSLKVAFVHYTIPVCHIVFSTYEDNFGTHNASDRIQINSAMKEACFFLIFSRYSIFVGMLLQTDTFFP